MGDLGAEHAFFSRSVHEPSTPHLIKHFGFQIVDGLEHLCKVQEHKSVRNTEIGSQTMWSEQPNSQWLSQLFVCQNTVFYLSHISIYVLAPGDRPQTNTTRSPKVKMFSRLPTCFVYEATRSRRIILCWVFPCWKNAELYQPRQTNLTSWLKSVSGWPIPKWRPQKVTYLTTQLLLISGHTVSPTRETDLWPVLCMNI